MERDPSEVFKQVWKTKIALEEALEHSKGRVWQAMQAVDQAKTALEQAKSSLEVQQRAYEEAERALMEAWQGQSGEDSPS